MFKRLTKISSTLATPALVAPVHQLSGHRQDDSSDHYGSVAVIHN